MTTKCPGQDFRKLTVSLHECTGCGAEVEMFSDETRIKCHKCGERVYKEYVPSCVDWCVSARQCLGEERWQELKGGNEPQPQKTNAKGEYNDDEDNQENGLDRRGQV